MSNQTVEIFRPLPTTRAPLGVARYIEEADKNGVEILYLGIYEGHAILCYGENVPRNDKGDTQYAGMWGLGIETPSLTTTHFKLKNLLANIRENHLTAERKAELEAAR